MDLSRLNDLSKRKKADLLVLPFWNHAKKATPASKLQTVQKELSPLLETGDFSAKEGETALLYTDKIPEGRILVLGLGDSEGLTVERLRRSFAVAAKFALQKKYVTLNVVVPQSDLLDDTEIGAGVAEGLLLPNYVFDLHKFKDDSQTKPKLIQKITLIGLDERGFEAAEKASVVSEGVYLVRDLVNGNADDVTPQYLAQVAKGFAKTLKNVETTVFDKKRIEKEKMGLLLAVNRGSEREPVLIITSYKGNPKSKDHTVIVGKGVTFDTGGLNLKPTGSMETMRGDMAGAAVALAVVMVAAELNLKVNVTAVVPSTENGIDAASYKPGDTYKSYSGKTVEIANTDAEGRLILADALAYSIDHLKPTRILDVATLTGSMQIAMGPDGFGFMSNDDTISKDLEQASELTGERVLRFPLFEDYRDFLKSDMADIKNAGPRIGGAIIAGIFLQEFVGKTPWAHLDIAPVDYYNEPRRYHPKHATGIGVRILVEYLTSLQG